METYAKQSKPSARTLSARAGHSQPDMATILQTYRNRTAQLAALTDDDEQALQGKFTTQLQEDDDEALQGKFVAQLQSDDDEEPLQGKFLTQLQSAEEEEPLQQKAENRTGLPDRLKNGVENLSGYSLDAIKVHYNSPKPAQLQALAYTQGTDIHVGPGQERYLGHEAWHVVQQMQGRVQPTTQLQGVAVNDNEGLEREADVMGEKVLQQMPITKKGQGIISEHAVSQFKLNFNDTAKKYDPEDNTYIQSSYYREQCQNLAGLSSAVDVEENNKLTDGIFGTTTNEKDGVKKTDGLWVFVKPMPTIDKVSPDYEPQFTTRIGTLAHEMQHAMDRLGVSIIREKMHREWRAWAVQAVVTAEHWGKDMDLSGRDELMLDSFLNSTFAVARSAFFRKTSLYLGKMSLPNDEKATKQYIQDNAGWLEEAKKIFWDKYRNMPVKLNPLRHDNQEV